MEWLEQAIIFSRKKVFKISCNGRDYYVKKNINRKRTVFHQFQSIIFQLTHNPLFAPTVLGKRENRVLFEVQKLMKLKGMGLSVPAVVRYTDQFFVMEDCGNRLDLMVGQTPERDRVYLFKAIGELAKLHQCRECHGGCQLRNFTWGNNRVFMIDFEERTPKEHFYGIVLRDLLLFLLSAIRAGVVGIDWTALIDYYEAESGIEVKSRLVRVFKSALFLCILTKKPFAQMLGRDAVDTLTALKTLEYQAK